jgi:hypothetical protein
MMHMLAIRALIYVAVSAGLVLGASGYIHHREAAAVKKARYADAMLLREATKIAKDKQAKIDADNADKMAEALKPWEAANAELYEYAVKLEKTIADDAKDTALLGDKSQQAAIRRGWSAPTTAVIRSKVDKINATILKGTVR